MVSQPLRGQQPAVVELGPHTLQHVMWVLLGAALLPSKCNETLFQAAIQGVLVGYDRRKGAVATAAPFADYHVRSRILLPAFFLGLVLEPSSVGQARRF